MRFLFFIAFFLIVFTASAEADTCKGKNGPSKRITNEKGIKILETGDFQCDTLWTGRIYYTDESGNNLYVLQFSKGKYLGEVDPETNGIKERKNFQGDSEEYYNEKTRVDEGGEIIDGRLTNGKKYLYYTNGLLYKILLFKKGKLAGEIPQKESPCKGINGSSERIKMDESSKIIEKGFFRCDTLINGTITYKDSSGNILYVLKFEEKIYLGEIDPKNNKLKTPRRNNDDRDKYENQKLTETGVFKNNVLVTGKKYMYDTNGLLYKILIFKDGKIFGQAQLEK